MNWSPLIFFIVVPMAALAGASRADVIAVAAGAAMLAGAAWAIFP